MTILSELYATGGTDVKLHTIDLRCEAWPEPIVLVKDYVNHSITTEDGELLVALSCGMDVKLPKRDNKGAQDLTFAIDNVRGEASTLLREALRTQKPVYLTYRCYLASDLTRPAETPYKFIVRNYRATAATVEITSGVFDLINLAFPRFRYDPIFSPAIKYL